MVKQPTRPSGKKSPYSPLEISAIRERRWWSYMRNREMGTPPGEEPRPYSHYRLIELKELREDRERILEDLASIDQEIARWEDESNGQS